jgi:hypothetical protein
MSKTFKGVELTLGPGGVYPKNSAIEAIERRRIAREETIRAGVRARSESSGKRIVTRKKNLKFRDDFVCDWYSRERKKRPRYSIRQLGIDLLWFLDKHASGKKTDPKYSVDFLEKLRKSLHPTGEFLSDDALSNIVLATRGNPQIILD